MLTLDFSMYRKANAWFDNISSLSTHRNAQGALYCAFEICTYIDWLIKKYTNYFRKVSLIHTGAVEKNPLT